jgi:hypothetical protein
VSLLERLSAWPTIVPLSSWFSSSKSKPRNGELDWHRPNEEVAQGWWLGVVRVLGALLLVAWVSSLWRVCGYRIGKGLKRNHLWV